MRKILIITFSIFFIFSVGPFVSSAKPLTKKISKPFIMILTSSAFQHQGLIPAKYTCDGDDISPPLQWSNEPKGTKSFVLIVDDPDAIAVAGFVWDHWILFNIPSTIHDIKEHSSVGIEGVTSFGKPGYGGPCPPNGTHAYHFKLYALDTMVTLKKSLPAGRQGALKSQLEKAMKGHVLAQAELLGKYDRVK